MFQSQRRENGRETEEGVFNQVIKAIYFIVLRHAPVLFRY